MIRGILVDRDAQGSGSAVGDAHPVAIAVPSIIQTSIFWKHQNREKPPQWLNRSARAWRNADRDTRRGRGCGVA